MAGVAAVKEGSARVVGVEPLTIPTSIPPRREAGQPM
jgi:hypothetical protein